MSLTDAKKSISDIEYFQKKCEEISDRVLAEPLTASVVSVESVEDAIPVNLSAYCSYSNRNITRSVFCGKKFIECVDFTNGSETAWP